MSNFFSSKVINIEGENIPSILTNLPNETNELNELNELNYHEKKYIENEMNDFVEKTVYSPIYSYLGIRPQFSLQDYVEKKTYNEYVFKDPSGNLQPCFKKFITLVDYVKYLIGKYKGDDLSILPAEAKEETKVETSDLTKSMLAPETKSLFREAIQSCHNYAYVDSFFYYVTDLLHKKGFVHGIQVYDSYICIQKEVEINVADDFEYICDSNYFNDKLNTLFHFKDETVFSKKTQSPIHISDEDVQIDMEELSGSEEEVAPSEISEVESEPTVEATESADEYDNDSEISHTDEECEEETQSMESMEDPIDLILVLKDMPTQVVTLEKCENTLDSLLEKNELRVEELESAMFQVIVMLYTYQALFDFTHNDLHTNNIMYIPTDQEFLHYQIKGKFYKIPTFGKIYKIIDFGRAIYTVNEKVICSDSFSEHGMAYTQYNFEPFYNSQKPRLLPNKSFDLCRLGCSIIDFIIDDLNDLEKFKKVPIYDLVISWIYDDSGVNVLYKKNGEDRYPDFKLYKMIARIVHNHTPDRQLDHACFEKYVTTHLESFMNIDDLISAKMQVQ